jgi:cytochrome c oxidase subunit 2
VNPVVAVPEGQEAKRNWMHFTIREEGVFWGQCAEFCGEAHALMGIRVVAESEEEFQAWVADWKTPAPTANAPEVVATAGGNGSGNGAALEGESAVSGPNAQEGDSAQEEPVVAEDPLVARGREVFFRETTCVLCHAIEGTAAPGIIGPNLTRIGSRSTIAAGMLENTQENLARWIKDPKSIKPGVQMPGADYPASYEGLTYPATGLNDEQIQALAAYLSSMR